MVRPVGFIFVLFAVEVNCTLSGGIGRQFETSAGVENTNMHRVFQSHLNDPAKAARIVNSFFPLANPESSMFQLTSFVTPKLQIQ